MAQVERELFPGEGKSTLAGISAILKLSAAHQVGHPHMDSTTVEYAYADEIVAYISYYLYACAVEETRLGVVVV
jgi:hypothetical protein